MTMTSACRARLTEFREVSRVLPPLPGRWASTDRPGGPLTPKRWGAAVSRRYRRVFPQLATVCDALDRLHLEHSAANAMEKLDRDLRRLTS